MMSTSSMKPKKRSSDDDANKMWIEKYRPNRLSSIIGHESIIETIDRLVSERRLPHLLLHGPPGTGKTTTVLACAKALNGESTWQSMTLELNASDDRGISVIREQIKTFASTKQIMFNKSSDSNKKKSGFKLVILDEADAMTSAAQFALRRVIEKYTKTTRFCLICNFVNKIIPALQSRCTKFRFQPISSDSIRERLCMIAEKESVDLSDDGCKAIMRLSHGDMRKCLNILQSTHASFPGQTIDLKCVYLCTGQPMPKDIEQCMDWLLNRDFKEAFQSIQELQINKGLALTDIIEGIHTLVLRMKLPVLILVTVLNQLSDLEYRLSTATQEKLQLASLVGIFQIVRHQMYQSKGDSTETATVSVS